MNILRIPKLLVIGTSLLFSFLISSCEYAALTLSNKNEDSRGKVVVSRKNELSVTVPQELQSKPLSQLRFELVDSRSKKRLPTTVIDRLPPYGPADLSKSYERVTISLKPKRLYTRDYELNIYDEDILFRSYPLVIDREIVTILDY